MDTEKPTTGRLSLPIKIGSIKEGATLFAWIAGTFALVLAVAGCVASESAAGKLLGAGLFLPIAILILPPTYGLLRRFVRWRWLPIARVAIPVLLVAAGLISANIRHAAEDKARLAAEEAQRQDPAWQKAQEEAFQREVELLKKQRAAEETVAKKEAALREKEAAEYAASPAGRICAAHPSWGREECEMLADNQIWVGMSYDMLVYLRGKPNHINPSNYGGGNRYQYCWNSYTPSCFYDNNDDGIIDAYN